jgi:MFS superfamily sulfate permease-like transporter
MQPLSGYSKFIKGVRKDSLIILLLFAALCFVELSLAVYVGSVSFSILLIRRIMLYYNPGFIKGHHIYAKEKELTVAKEVDVFNLGEVSSIEYLNNYTEVIWSILMPPRIFIIRFSGVFLLRESELDILKKVILRLQTRKIIVILSDIEKNILDHVGWYKIENQVGVDHIFFNIYDALDLANKELK